VDEALKHRLVGAFILVMLAVIFLPIIFDGDNGRDDVVLKARPPKPEAPKIEVSDPKPVAPKKLPVHAKGLTETEIQEKQQKIKVSSSKKRMQLTREMAPRLDQKGLPVTWSIQFASFKSEKSAISERERLRKAGYKAYVRSAATSGGNRFRVLVGPELRVDSANQLKVKLESKYRVKGLIVVKNQARKVGV